MKNLYFCVTSREGVRPRAFPSPQHHDFALRPGFRNCISCTSHKVSKTRPQTSVNLDITWRDPGITYLGRGIFVETPAISWSQVPTLLNHLPIILAITPQTNSLYILYRKIPNCKKIFGKSHWNIFYWNFLWSFFGGTKCRKKCLEKSRKPSKPKVSDTGLRIGQ